MLLFLLLVAVPVIEIALFIQIGGEIGTWPTIAIVILTALIGSVMLRQQGLRVLQDVQGRLMSGEDPGRLLADGAMILVSGALLLTPGFFTDAVGFLLLVPAVRGIVYAWLKTRIRMQTVTTAQATGRRQGAWTSGGGQTVDGTYEDVTPDAERAGTQEPGEPPQPPLR
ncbi:MAG: FxsA family protein [Pseudomonadota bacterium]